MKGILLFLITIVFLMTSLPAQAQSRIIDFSTSATGIERDTLDEGLARISITWVTVNRPLVTNLVFEQVLPDGTVVNVELPRPFRWVNSSDSGIVAPVSVGDSNQITLRVSLVNIVRDDIIYDTRYLYIPVLSATTSLEIMSFTSTRTTISALSVEAGDNLIDVTWSVSNRPSGTNLVFEQVLPDGTVRNAELPRDVLIVSSDGSGIVLATLPMESISELVFQVRLVDLNNNDTLALEELTINVIDNRANISEMTATPPADTTIVINDFSVDTASTPGNTQVTFSWDITGDFSEASIKYPVRFETETVLVVQSNTGSGVHTIPTWVWAGEKTITLNVEDPSGVIVSRELTLDITCTWEWQITASETGCSSPFISRVGAYQQFQRGFMIWMPRSNVGDAIYIFYNDGTADGRSDRWDGSDFVIDGIAPDGLFAPENGFGYMWNTVPNVRSGLGWAISPEQAYTINSQAGFILNRNDPHRTYYSLPDGSLVHLDGTGGLYQRRTWENAE